MEKIPKITSNRLKSKNTNYNLLNKAFSKKFDLHKSVNIFINIACFLNISIFYQCLALLLSNILVTVLIYNCV